MTRGVKPKVYRDFPFKEVTARAEELAAQGHRCYQKFTCEGCGQRLGIQYPNVFHKKGTCDKCGHLTDIEKRGCNYLLIISTGGVPPKI